MKEEERKMKEREGKRGCVYKGEVKIITSLPYELKETRLASHSKIRPTFANCPDAGD